MTPLGGVGTRALALLSLAGGLVGAVLLLATPETAFGLIIPWLLLAASLALAAGPRLNRGLRSFGLRAGPRGILAVQFLLGIYGGYFGGAVGLMMLAGWSLLSELDIAVLTPLRTLMTAAANTVAVLLFVINGAVSWIPALAVTAGAIAGGYLGARLGRRMPRVVLRGLILAITFGTTLVFFARAYL
jgi:uncharacterized membrane protein YfcA